MWPKRFLSLILSTSKQIQTESIYYKEGTCIEEYMLNNTSTENMSLQTFLTNLLERCKPHQYLGTCNLFVIDIFCAQNLCHAELWVNGGITPHNFNLGTRERWVFQLLVLVPWGKSSLNMQERRLSCPQMGSRH